MQRIILLLKESLILLVLVGFGFKVKGEETHSEKALKNGQVIPFSIPESCHTQGMAIDENYIYLSCCDLLRKRGLIYRIKRDALEMRTSVSEIKYDRLELTIGAKYHPSGMDINGECLWVALAEYHPAPASSTFICIDRSGFKEIHKKRFGLDDHIGAIASTENWIVAFNWDARNFYIIDYSGKILTKGKNPDRIAYQDCKHNDDNSIICSGTSSSISLKGYVDTIEMRAREPDGFRLKGRIITGRAEGKLIPLTREAMALEGKKIYFLPTDFPELLIYRFDLMN